MAGDLCIEDDVTVQGHLLEISNDDTFQPCEIKEHLKRKGCGRDKQFKLPKLWLSLLLFMAVKVAHPRQQIGPFRNGALQPRCILRLLWKSSNVSNIAMPS